MEKSIRERIREAMQENDKNSRVPTKEEHEYAKSNRDERFADLCCRIAEAYALKKKAYPDDLTRINVLMGKT